MKRKYIIQIKRGFYYEDVLTYYDAKAVKIALLKLLQSDINARIVEVVYL